MAFTIFVFLTLLKLALCLPEPDPKVKLGLGVDLKVEDIPNCDKDHEDPKTEPQLIQILKQILQKMESNCCICPDSGCCKPVTPTTPATTFTTTTEPTTIITTTTKPTTTTTGYCDTLRTTICPDGSRCHADASCLGSSVYTCQCNLGFTGDGADCGKDSDLDGWPDDNLICCKVLDNCRADNCPNKPNSGNEDDDLDGIGNVCDNCPSVSNPGQEDSDGDKIGDACENTTTDPSNPPSTTTPSPFCKPIKRNKCSTSDAWKTKDSDGDGHMDSCDNCPHVHNVDQEDTDHNHVGDACHHHQDTDGDGINDGIDNCIDVYNEDQSDVDYDGLGDKCDDDMDDDGITNVKDNCRLVPNSGQEDSDNDGYGDVCQNDKDGDCDDDDNDICPKNPIINKVDFGHFTELILEPTTSSHQGPPLWVIRNNGQEIIEEINSRAGLMSGHHIFSGVDFEGTFFIDCCEDDDYAGFIFGFKNSKEFYVAMWKRANQAYFGKLGSPMALAGIQLKKVHSTSGPSGELANALWKTGDTLGEVTLLWHDRNQVPWEHETAYRWQLIHRPHIGLIRFRFLTGASIIADSGNIYDDDIKSGRLGVYVHSQAMLSFSDLKYNCNDDSVPQLVYDDLPVDKQAKVTIDFTKQWSAMTKIMKNMKTMKNKPLVALTEPGLNKTLEDN